MILDFSQNNIFVVFEITDNNNVALKYFSMLPPSIVDKNSEHCLTRVTILT